MLDIKENYSYMLILSNMVSMLLFHFYSCKTKKSWYDKKNNTNIHILIFIIFSIQRWNRSTTESFIKCLPGISWSRNSWEDQDQSQSLKEERKWLLANPKAQGGYYRAAGPLPWYPAIRGHLANQVCWCEA